jgi:Zn-dependent M28 family amino/carboxypeptidase
VAITMAAARAISRLPRYPRRTIRVVLFGAEEMDESAAPYAALHADDNIIAASESDFGGGRIWKLMLPERSRDHVAVKMASGLLAPLGVFIDRTPAPYCGADLAGLQRAGTPVFLMGADGSRYFDVHHSADDTLEKVDREDLNQAVASWATVVYLLADSDIDFREPAPEPVADEPPVVDAEPGDPLERLAIELNAEEADE